MEIRGSIYFFSCVCAQEKEHFGFFLGKEKRNNEIILHRRDYVAHEVLPEKPKRSEKRVKRHENVDLTSTYRHHYNSQHYVSSISMTLLEDEETYLHGQYGYKNYFKRLAPLAALFRTSQVTLFFKKTDQNSVKFVFLLYMYANKLPRTHADRNR